MHRRILGVVALIGLLAGCAGGSGQTSTVTPTAAPITSPKTSASISTPSTSPSIAAGNYATLTSGGWAKVLAMPDMYLGETLQLWGCITQLDPPTAPDGFRAQTSHKEESDWSANGKLAVFTSSKAALADYAKSDVVALKVVGRGSASGAPLFEVVEITKVGSCG